MRTKFAKLLKPLLLICVAMCYSCETKNTSVKSTDIIISGQSIKIYVIDSCEYIGYINGCNADWCTHKGNCKYCTERVNRTHN